MMFSKEQLLIVKMRTRLEMKTNSPSQYCTMHWSKPQQHCLLQCDTSPSLQSMHQPRPSPVVFLAKKA